MQHGPTCPLHHLWLWGRGVPVVSACGHWSSFDSRWGCCLRFRHCWAIALVRLTLICWTLAVICQSLSSLHAFIKLLGGWRHFGWPALCGDVGGMMWHVGNMEGTPYVVDAGDVGVWLSGLLVRRLSCFVGGVGG